MTYEKTAHAQSAEHEHDARIAPQEAHLVTGWVFEAIASITISCQESLTLSLLIGDASYLFTAVFGMVMIAEQVKHTKV